MAERTDRSVLDVEFTYGWYGEFLDRLRAAGYGFRGFGTDPGDADVLLRHDVDLSLDAAARMARLEADRGVRATYFVLLTSNLYNPLDGDHRDRLREIESLGHDVGLHFSTHEYWSADDRPPAEGLRARVLDEVSVLRTVASDPAAVSFHIPPTWVQGRTFEGFRSAYEPAVFEEVEYLADSTQRWRSEPPEVEAGGPLQVLAHPGLWDEEDAGFEGRVEQAVVDACRRSQRAARAEFVAGVDG